MSAGAAGEPASVRHHRAFAGEARPWLARGWVFVLTVASLWAAAVLRSTLAFDGRQRVVVLVLLAVWLGVVAAESPAARRWRPAFAVSLVAQSLLVFSLLTQSDASDYFAVLLAVPVMRAMHGWPPRAVAVLIAAFAALTGLALAFEYGVAGAVPLVALYAAANVFFAAYAYAARRALEARRRSEALAADLREANRRLEESAEQAERLGAARERQHLARDLHDSVTQTLFSMTLTAQSALLLLQRDPRGVEAQLDQLDELARAARDELASLSVGPPALPASGGLAGALELHCAERAQRDGLAVRLEVDGSATVSPEEDEALLRIVQEALNNVVKHAGVREAAVRLRLRRPLRLEVQDQGRGFRTGDVGGSGLGLTGMRERAAERGWSLVVTSSPGAGTKVVVEEDPSGVREGTSMGVQGDPAGEHGGE